MQLEMSRDLRIADFQQILGDTLPDGCHQAIAQNVFKHRPLHGTDREDVFLRVLKALDSPLESAGRHRHHRWESGWTENLEDFIASEYDVRALVPKFVKRGEVIRFRGEYVLPTNPYFETSFVTVLRRFLFQKWFANVEHIFEFGCGTAHNLVEAANMFPDKALHGLDWTESSLKIISLLKQQLDIRIDSAMFDMLKPDAGQRLPSSSGVLTIGALEQLGTQFEPFLEYLVAQAPEVCVHVETLYEEYSQNDLFDYVAARYIEKRGYLRGFLPALRNLESAGDIKIEAVKRTFGSLYHDGYSFLVWRPATVRSTT